MWVVVLLGLTIWSIIGNHQGYGDDAVYIHVSHTRSAVIPEQHYWFYLKPITVDGFAGYEFELW